MTAALAARDALRPALAVALTCGFTIGVERGSALAARLSGRSLKLLIAFLLAGVGAASLARTLASLDWSAAGCSAAPEGVDDDRIGVGLNYACGATLFVAATLLWRRGGTRGALTELGMALGYPLRRWRRIGSRAAATPGPRRGYSAGDKSRRRRGRDVEIRSRAPGTRWAVSSTTATRTGPRPTNARTASSILYLRYRTRR